MDRVLRCDCGFEAAGASDDELVASAQAHASEAHGTELAAETVLRLARQGGAGPTETAEDGRPA